MIDREKPLLSKRNVAAWLSFAELRCFAHLNAANQHKRLIPTLKILLLNMLSQAIKSLGVLIFHILLLLLCLFTWCFLNK